MASQASNFLPRFCLSLLLACSLGASGFAASPLDSELSDALQKKDWPSVVLLLEPKKGQNFEHDLTLSKALLSLERRQEALKLLATLQETRKDERVTKLFQSAGTIFFAQETSNLYYEALELIKGLKFAEAKERIDQGLSKEPGQVLLLTRQIQLQLLLGQKEQASANLKIVQTSTANMPELRLFAAKLAVDHALTSTEEDEDAAELYKGLSSYKAQLLENEVTTTYWAESLKRAKRTGDLEALEQKILKEHPLWTYSLQWFRLNAAPAKAQEDKLRDQIDKNLKDKTAFLAALEAEMKKADYLWVGYVTYEGLVALAKPTPTPVATP